MSEDAEVERVILALEKLIRMFQPERYLYIFGSIVGLGMAIYYTFYLINTNQFTAANASMTIGSSGLVAMATFRTSHFFNKAFNLLEKLILAQRGQ